MAEKPPSKRTTTRAPLFGKGDYVTTLEEPHQIRRVIDVQRAGGRYIYFISHCPYSEKDSPFYWHEKRLSRAEGH